MLKYEKMVLGEMQTNSYLLWDEDSKEAMVIDPADDGVEIAQELQKLGLKPIVIACTHGHFDHLLGALDLMLIFKIPLCLSKLDAFLLERLGETAEYFLGHKINVPNIKKIDIDFNKVVSIRLGDKKIVPIKTPGHTPGSVSIHCPSDKLLFTGDTLFANGFLGETSHKYSSLLDMRKSLKRLLELPEETLVLSGHGDEDTIGNCKTILEN
jgi:glyoxylase-like metal-dependent hydrolase (beta-lactamase superfamily II)